VKKSIEKERVSVTCMVTSSRFKKAAPETIVVLENSIGGILVCLQVVCMERKGSKTEDTQGAPLCWRTTN
jgi:hypothetical protein